MSDRTLLLYLESQITNVGTYKNTPLLIQRKAIAPTTARSSNALPNASLVLQALMLG